MTGYAVALIAVDSLRPSEHVDPGRVAALADEIVAAGELRQPILVERESLTILDGHHRWHAARCLGLARIPAIALSYQDPRLTLASWSERSFSPDDVLRAAATGQLLPAKSTRHILAPAPGPEPVSLCLLGPTRMP
ncbi:MAG: transcriptional regulator [Alphaproteobacteria bacterium]|nr:transcriptional regulator [Alphaproteobacteria bacterium]